MSTGKLFSKTKETNYDALHMAVEPNRGAWWAGKHEGELWIIVEAYTVGDVWRMAAEAILSALGHRVTRD